ncbi:MAG TPA: OmpA family protein [Rhodopila sp.]|uniref:OmpA family protein n=1 Tax=Rhodopila sp. TaxID=2480087 RepID=UPI002C5996CF|nr:OmpA family protein [Rhodopila sp.]HVY14136.1 OmpA family protein [Rhodopila sp.]
MRLSNAILASAFLAIPAAALAQPVDGLYIGGGVGLHIPQNPQVTPMGPGYGNRQINLDENLGFNSELSLGYGFGNGFRVELEGDFMRSGVRSLQGTNFPTAPGGAVRTWGLMGNALYDFDVGTPYVFPYVGLGAGYQWTKFNDVSFQQPGGPFSFNSDSQSGSFAWQAIVGASFPLPWVRGLSATADYRFMDILGGQKFDSSGTAGGMKLHNQFDHELVFGVRYAFNTPSPPPPAPTPVATPAPAPARSYLVFFDWDKASLTDRARQIIKEAADNSTHVQYTRIDVNGYTDTSGTPRYNQGLSERRANAVAGELVRDGVPQNAISVQGFGETHLLVPTGPGVREPQNRRVEIVIH